jgi:hypothetical protein
VKRLLVLLAVVLVSPLASGQRELEAARRAAELLGPEVWSQVLQIERRAEPRIAYATVFELGGLLWLYDPACGTQSLSLHRDQLAREKANLHPLLRAVEPRLTRFVALPPAPAQFDRAAALPNGCFVESYAAWRERSRLADPVLEARLLSYYVLRSGRLQGHTVLTYLTPTGVFVLDPAVDHHVPRRLDGVPLTDATRVASSLRADLVIAKACWVPAPLAPSAGRTPGGSPLRYARADKVE